MLRVASLTCQSLHLIAVPGACGEASWEHSIFPPGLNVRSPSHQK